ncbi:hypothetical protein IE53DRAFT_372305 [Violaceomyces palustris]|uniref:Uncharacterized protein n=1 Tax=Violaceomyces palustris TaxID=1673888 RepID=A0ACD0NL60_9BASI|nr:hypothetical protein IE53DRAFT_372305 [Violaceomyces palustris]
MRPEQIERTFVWIIKKFDAPDTPLLRAYIAHKFFKPGQTTCRPLTAVEILHLPVDFFAGFPAWAADSIHPSEDPVVVPVAGQDEPGPSRLAPPAGNADLSFNMAYPNNALEDPRAKRIDRRQISGPASGPQKDDPRPKTSEGLPSKASALATPARPQRPIIPPSPRSLKVSMRENVIRRWIPCARCVKFNRLCLPPAAGDTKQVRCQACQEDRSHPACSTGRLLFGKQNRINVRPGRSSDQAIVLSSDEDFEILSDPPSPRPPRRPSRQDLEEDGELPALDSRSPPTNVVPSRSASPLPAVAPADLQGRLARVPDEEFVDLLVNRLRGIPREHLAELIAKKNKRDRTQ